MRFRYLLAAALTLGACGMAWAVDGEIRKLDTVQGKVTIKHGEIKALDMPAMTMVYKALPSTLLDGLAVGDQVSFEADKKDGTYVVTALRKR